MDEQLQQEIMALVLDAMNGDQLAALKIKNIFLAAELGNREAQQYAMLIQLVMELMQQDGGQLMMNLTQPVSMARNGAKLAYIDRLRGKCPEGYEVGYFKKGGNLCKACVKKKQKMLYGGDAPEPTNAVDAFKYGRKVQKKKCEAGAPIEMDKCGGKAKKKKKAACGSKLTEKMADGGKSNNGGFYRKENTANVSLSHSRGASEDTYLSRNRLRPRGNNVVDKIRYNPFDKKGESVGYAQMPTVVVSPGNPRYISDPNIGVGIDPSLRGYVPNVPVVVRANGGSLTPFTNRGLR